MKQFVITLTGMAESQKMIRQYLHNHYHPPIHNETYGDHIVEQSELQWYVQAGFRCIKVYGPYEEVVNKFLENRMTVSHFFIPAMNSLVVQEMVLPDLANVVHVIHFETGKISQVELPEGDIQGVRPNTTELLVLARHLREWFLFDLLDGRTQQICDFGDDFYLSSDGNYFLPMDFSKVGLVDLETGTLLDVKNKRHFSRYATRVKIVQGLYFDPERFCLFVLLMKKLELSFSSMKNEVCLSLTMTD
jgi:hypothetical protein